MLPIVIPKAIGINKLLEFLNPILELMLKAIGVIINAIVSFTKIEDSRPEPKIAPKTSVLMFFALFKAEMTMNSRRPDFSKPAVIVSMPKRNSITRKSIELRASVMEMDNDPTMRMAPTTIDIQIGILHLPTLRKINRA